MYVSLEKYELALLLDPEGDAMEEEMEFLRSLLKIYEPSVQMPKLKYRQQDYGGVSFWSVMRETRRDEAFIKYLGVPLFLFDELTERMKDHLPTMYDPFIRVKGRQCIFDYVDLTALGLRRLRVACSQKIDLLCSEFGRNKSVVSRALDDATRALFVVLRQAPSAEVRLPNAAEVRNMVTGVKAELGEEGLYGLASKTVLLCDGTVTPATKDSNEEKQKLLKGHKGHCWNHILMVSIF